MALDSIPPWLQIGPAYFTQALEAGARTGLALTEANQRAQQLAEARAERAAQMQERQAQDAQRQQQFEESRLLDVQRLAQTEAHQQAQQAQQVAELAQLGGYRKQQAKHQAALEAHQAAQESRLLNYDTGRLAADRSRADTAAKRAALAEMQANAPTVWIPHDPNTGAPGHFKTGSRLTVPPETDKPPTPATLGALYNAQERSLLNQLDDDPQLGIAAARDPKHPKRPIYDEIQSKLLDVRKHRDALVPPAKGTNAPASAKPIAVSGQGTREDPARPETPEQMDSLPSGAIYRNPSDGKLYRKK